MEPKVRNCENTCGGGKETCTNGVWGTCKVERIEKSCFSACGTGIEICENNQLIPCNAPTPLPPKLFATIRDFKIEHPDFERMDLTGDYADKHIVAEDLGIDNLPVFIATSANPTVTTKENFDQWYRDVPYVIDPVTGVKKEINQTTSLWLQLAESPTQPGLFYYENKSFFPIDGQFFGNEGLPHNYHFTMAVQTSFIYVGGEVFSFEGDDDMWVFINRKLAIDLGGIHGPERASIALDEKADYLGISRGGFYQLDFFFAERKTIQSDFTIRTTIADVGSCP
jgi:fibro-slime domain-containing protein